MTILPRAAILMVDDEPAVLSLLHRMMRSLAADYDLIPVSTGAMALAQATQRHVALVITDHQMPEMDGGALIKALKAVTPDCPVVLVSGYLTPEVIQDGRAAGADFFLPKPFPLNRLADVVQQALPH